MSFFSPNASICSTSTAASVGDNPQNLGWIFDPTLMTPEKVCHWFSDRAAEETRLSADVGNFDFPENVSVPPELRESLAKGIRIWRDLRKALQIVGFPKKRRFILEFLRDRMAWEGQGALWNASLNTAFIEGCWGFGGARDTDQKDMRGSCTREELVTLSIRPSLECNSKQKTHDFLAMENEKLNTGMKDDLPLSDTDFLRQFQNVNHKDPEAGDVDPDQLHRDLWRFVQDEVVLGQYFFTVFGSRRYGCDIAGGDIDICICLHDRETSREGCDFLEDAAERLRQVRDRYY